MAAQLCRLRFEKGSGSASCSSKPKRLKPSFSSLLIGASRISVPRDGCGRVRRRAWSCSFSVPDSSAEASFVVLGIAQDRMAHGQHVGAQLVGAAGVRPQRHPGRAVGRRG